MSRFVPAVLSTLFVVLCLVPVNSSAQVNVLTWHNDAQHTGQNLQETILTPSNVNAAKFGKLFSYPVDGMVYAQPLYVQGVTINGTAHNVVYVATENDTVYAFDADSATLNPNPLWKTSYSNPPNVVAMPCTENDPYCNVYPTIGITGTPVINLANQSIYFVTRTKETGPKGGVLYAERLHALNIATGAEQPGSPKLICSAGKGKGCNLGPYTLASQQFVPQHQMQRPALTLTPYPGTAQGVVYAAFGQDRGWLIAFDAATLQMLAVFCTAPNVTLSGKGLSGFWGSGGAVAADTNGNLYAATADGVFDVDQGGADYGDTVIKLGLNFNSSTSQYSFSVLDYFSPSDQSCRYDNDDDLGSGSPMLLPPQLGASTSLMIMAGKGYPCDGVISPVYLIDPNNMGGASGTTLQTVDGPQGGYWSGGAYWQSATTTYIYYSGLNSEDEAPAGDNLREFTMAGGVFSPGTAVAQSLNRLTIGSTPSISANGNTNGILWAIARQDLLSIKPGSKPAVLYAFDATNVAHQLYSTAVNPTRDRPGAGVKFVVPTIANGKVYVATQTEIDVYGLLSGAK
ncbi:MAG TPA: PQQ-binding-like beta-propeller repeat protein [Candidatus Solibacter sp.]|nr:PQQ-binding-like beta-propeller repeat protein [Candidatus Solibacter sp.]